MLRHLLCMATVSAFAGSVLAAEPVIDQDQRLQEVEQRLDRLETAPPVSAPAKSAGSFNPAVSLILSGIYAQLAHDPADYRITGFPLPLGAEFGPGTRGISLAESELAIFANVDPYFYGGLTYSLHADDTASVEEAYIQTTALSNGFTVKAGRFFSAIGYVNSQHAHVWDFVEAPLAYQALLGMQFGDDGVQLKWLAPTDLFIEVGAELTRGAAYPGSDRDANGIGARSLFAHAGGDVGVSNSWRTGVSMLSTSPRDREFADIDLANNDVLNRFNGDSRTWVADFVWKYAPNGNSVYTNLKLQAEYLRRHEQGEVTYDAGEAFGPARASTFDATQSGWYLQAVYQFRPYWRIGLRHDRLDSGSVDYGANNAVLPRVDFEPTRNTMMLDYSPSEFSRIRLQYARDEARQGVVDDQFFLQYQMSIGAHGAHQF